MSQTPSPLYKGTCSCKKVEFETRGDPLFTQYCHCHKCRSFTSQSVRKEDKRGYSHTAAYLRDHFEIMKGADNLEEHPVKNSYLYLCKNCKSLIYGISQDKSQQQGIGINVSNFSFKEARLPESFNPIRHVYYGDRTVDMDDDLPKFVDFPSELGGSGERCD